ncbi:hypothetical protein [Actinomadura darangshiensis]|uniref:hypothetical protein n=1 Tax=Actinomadura darangshiensis TaxID=705336 RepID=UPI00140777EF|nr:hypothetical protein [Actinomadura darangshiensis]
MTDRFRGQDPDNEYAGEDEYGTQDQMSSSMHDEASLQQEQGGSAPRPESEFTSGGGDYSGQGEHDGVQSRPGAEEEYEDETGEDDLGTIW